MTLTLLKIPGKVLEESPNASQSIVFLTKVLNQGYDVVKHKFNIITSTRIKNHDVFIEDLGIQAEGAFLLLLIQDSNQDKDSILQNLRDGKIELQTADNKLSFANFETSQVLGTIAAKPKVSDQDGSLGWEITGFTSFFRGVGKFMISQLEIKARATKGVNFLFASVIAEHQLVPYYSQFGFEEIGERTLLSIDENGKVKGTALEDGIYANCDFHVAFLINQF